jgi:hypothetical protein
VDSAGNTLEFLLSHTRDTLAAKRFFRKAIGAPHVMTPRVINVDQNPAYPKAVAELQAEGKLPPGCQLRPVKYLNNVLEQDHRFIKRLVRPGLGFFSFPTAWRTLRLRDNAHDTEGTSRNRWSPGPGQVRRLPVWIGCLTFPNPSLHNTLAKLVRFLQQNPPGANNPSPTSHPFLATEPPQLSDRLVFYQSFLAVLYSPRNTSNPAEEALRYMFSIAVRNLSWPRQKGKVPSRLGRAAETEGI